MANVEFPDYMKGVSGTLRTMTLQDGTKRKIIVTCSKSGKQRIYFRDYKPRTTQPSDKERKQRDLFTNAASFYRDLSEQQKQRYQREYKKALYKYHGKKYATLRGYVIARFIANDIALVLCPFVLCTLSIVL